MTNWKLPELRFEKSMLCQNEANSPALIQALESYSIKGEIVSETIGPVVTRYEFKPVPGFKIENLRRRLDDIARAMCVTSAFISPIPGRATIGIDIPNRQKGTIHFEAPKPDGLALYLGCDTTGKDMCQNLIDFPHLLVAGTTGSGKSVALNGILASMLVRHTPDELRLILVDPKFLELTPYNGLPHLLFPVATTPEDALTALQWAVGEMERRYKLLLKAKVKNIAQYPDKLPRIVIVVDEYADLLATVRDEFEDYIQRIAQKARAAGIHIIIATQRPSVDVVTGVIKANFPARICFKVASKHDSMTILNQPGGELLLGCGDMLFKSTTHDTMRIHGAFISDDQIKALVEQWSKQVQPKYEKNENSSARDPRPEVDGRERDHETADNNVRKDCREKSGRIEHPKRPPVTLKQKAVVAASILIMIGGWLCL